MAMNTIPHPLQHLNKAETQAAVEAIRRCHPDEVIEFRQIGLHEPPKAELHPFLELEHNGKLSSTTPRPARLAACQYDTIGSDKVIVYHEAVVDVNTGERIEQKVLEKGVSPSLTV